MGPSDGNTEVESPVGGKHDRCREGNAHDVGVVVVKGMLFKVMVLLFHGRRRRPVQEIVEVFLLLVVHVVVIVASVAIVE